MFKIGKTIMYIGEPVRITGKPPVIVRKFQNFKLLNMKGGCDHDPLFLDIGIKLDETCTGVICSGKERCIISSRPDETRWAPSKYFVPVDEDETELSHITIDEILEGSLPVFHELFSHNEKSEQT